MVYTRTVPHSSFGQYLVSTRTIPPSSYNYSKMLSSRVGLNRQPLDLKSKDARTLPTELPTHVVRWRKKDMVLTYTRTIPRIYQDDSSFLNLHPSGIYLALPLYIQGMYLLYRRHSPGEGVLVNTRQIPGIYQAQKIPSTVYTRHMPGIYVEKSCASQWTKFCRALPMLWILKLQ